MHLRGRATRGEKCLPSKFWELYKLSELTGVATAFGYWWGEIQ